MFEEFALRGILFITSSIARNKCCHSNLWPCGNHVCIYTTAKHGEHYTTAHKCSDISIIEAREMIYESVSN